MSHWRSRLTIRFAVTTVLFVGVCWLVTRDVLQSRRKARALAVVRELGCEMGSLGFWPFGEEIRITIRERDLGRPDLEKLTVLNPLTGRNWVGVAFVDTDLTREEVLELRTMLPGCVVFRVIDGETVRDR